MPIHVTTDPGRRRVEITYVGAVTFDDVQSVGAILSDSHMPGGRAHLLADFTRCTDWPLELFEGIGWASLRATFKYLDGAAFVGLNRFPEQARMVDALFRARDIPFCLADDRVEAETFLDRLAGAP